MIMIIGSVIIGLSFYSFGFPIHTAENGFNLSNSIILFLVQTLWVTVCEIIKFKRRKRQ